MALQENTPPTVWHECLVSLTRSSDPLTPLGPNTFDLSCVKSSQPKHLGSQSASGQAPSFAPQQHAAPPFVTDDGLCAYLISTDTDTAYTVRFFPMHGTSHSFSIHQLRESMMHAGILKQGKQLLSALLRALTRRWDGLQVAKVPNGLYELVSASSGEETSQLGTSFTLTWKVPLQTAGCATLDLGSTEVFEGLVGTNNCEGKAFSGLKCRNGMLLYSFTFMLLLLQGEYLGISCRAAKGRYLQARKRGRPHRLCFYSTHWGIWEQWQV